MGRNKLMSVVGISLALLLMQNCSGQEAGFSLDPTLSVLNQDPFSNNDPNNTQDINNLTGVLDDISTIDAVPYNTNTGETIADCSAPGRYEQEKAIAIQAAKADPTGKTVPVQFAFSFGDKHDVMAKYANSRAVLSAANNGKTIIPVGPHNSSKFNGKFAHYKADNTEAKENFMSGRRCFFDTIELETEDPIISDDKGFDIVEPQDMDRVHNIHYMYYGWCGGNADCSGAGNYNGDYANRLFEPVDGAPSDPQVIKIYMIDFRSYHFGPFDLLLVGSDLTRGSEQNVSMGDIINLELLHQNIDLIVQLLSQHLMVDQDGNPVNGGVGDGDQPGGGQTGTGNNGGGAGNNNPHVITFYPMLGILQALHNFLMNEIIGTIISTQYTPLVLDLGQKGIKTSSVRWGTYFNMSALEDLDKSKDDPNRYYVPHRTAWLGGSYKHFTAPNATTEDVRIVAEDGLLAIPDSDGKIRSSRNLFGDNMVVDGKTYGDGFAALRALADKDCDSSKIKDQYFGPWDGDLYSQTLKVWVDTDRDGSVDDGELKGLPASKVLAINTCNVVHSEATDAHGNGTELRSVFLMANQGETSITEEEVLFRLQTFKTSTGEAANLRLIVDIIFKTNEDLLLLDQDNVGKLATN